MCHCDHPSLNGKGKESDVSVNFCYNKGSFQEATRHIGQMNEWMKTYNAPEWSGMRSFELGWMIIPLHFMLTKNILTQPADIVYLCVSKRHDKMSQWVVVSFSINFISMMAVSINEPATCENVC